MLHNMLLEYDGLNEIQWENIEDDVVLEPVIPTVDAAIHLLYLTIHRYVPYHSYQYDLICEALMVHFYWKFLKGDARWPKKLKDI